MSDTQDNGRTTFSPIGGYYLLDYPTLVSPSPATRSAVSNGSQLFVDSTVDGRSKEARRFRDVLAEIVSDLGGADHLSEGQRQLARRCALMSVECEKME